MYVPFNATPLSDEYENYDAGFVVGAFLGDGSYDGKGALIYSLNAQEKETEVANKLRGFYENIGFKVSSSEERRHVIFHLVRGSNQAAESWMSQFIKGRTSHEKRLTQWAFQMGAKFLEGLLDGWYATDGGNRGRIYTVNKDLNEDFATVCALIGKAYTISEDGDEREGRYSDNPIYTLKFHTRTSYGDYYFYEDGYWWFPVKHIRQMSEYNSMVFCFTVDSDEHLFQLANGMITHNCRLRLDNRELRKRGGGLFGANPLTGSTGVVTVNLPRIGYLSKNEKEFFDRLNEMIHLAKKSLVIKRKVLENFTEKNLYPYSKFYLRDIKNATGLYWKNHFSTIGIIGMNEACLNFLGKDIGSDEGQEFSLRVMDFIRNLISDIQNETGDLFNLEATPAEGTSHRLAMLDKEQFADIICANENACCKGEAPYYSNSTHLPVNYTDDIFETLMLQDDLQTKYTGGCIEKGNKVITDKGTIKIEDIINNFKSLSPIKALSYNPETGQSEWDLITDAIKIDVSKHNKIKVAAERGVEITTSDWHPFFIMERISFDNQCPVCNESLKNVKVFAVHLRHNRMCREKYIRLAKYKVVEKRADELKEGDYILQNSQNLLPEKSLLDSELAYLIGFFIGDGSISEIKDNRGGNNLTKYTVRFFSEAKQTLDKISDILNRFFDCEAKPVQNDKRSEKLFEVNTSRKSVSDFLFKCGFFAGKKVYTVNIPSEVKNLLSKENFYSFLAGLIDSDGHIDKRNGTVEYYTVSEKLADDIVEFCTIAGISISKHRKTAQRENEADIYRLFISASQATRLKEQLPLQRNGNSIKEVLSNRLKRQLPVVRVLNTSKTEVADNDFYDLTTEKNHNYLAGNNSFVFVHNTVIHLYLEEQVDDIETVKNLVRKITDNFRLPYFTLTPTFSICSSHGYLKGKQEICPFCGNETEVYSRVVGYLRPVNQWNDGKQAEFNKRKFFKIDADNSEIELSDIQALNLANLLSHSLKMNGALFHI